MAIAAIVGAISIVAIVRSAQSIAQSIVRLIAQSIVEAIAISIPAIAISIPKSQQHKGESNYP